MASRQLRVFIVGDATEAARAADRVEKRFGTMGSKMGKIGATVTKAFKGAAVGTAAAIVTVLGKAVKSGWDRLASLERSEKMFSQMGLSAEDTKRVMDRLNDTVTGTAFSLDEGAAAMANLISAGAGLDSVGRQMDMIADAAAYGQAPLGEVAEIFQKIEINGKASRRELNQLAHRNIPVFSLLRDSLAMTGEEFDKFVKDGKLSSEVFLDAWEKGAKGFGAQGIKIEGAAKSMGDTVQGAMGNTMTALARFGAVLVGPVFRAMPKILEAATGGLNDLTKAAGPFIDRIGKDLGRLDLGRAVGVLKGAVPIFRDLGKAFVSLGRLGGDALPVVFSALVGGLSAALAVLRPVASLVESVTGFLADHSTMVIAAATAWLAWRGVSAVLTGIRGPLKGVVDGVASFVSVLQGTAATKGISTFRAGIGAMRSSMAGLAKSMGPAALGVVVAGIVGVGLAWQQAGQKAKAAIAEITAGTDETSVSSMAKTQAKLRAELDKANDSLGQSSGFWGDLGWSIKATGQAMVSTTGLIEPTMLNTARMSKELRSELEEQGRAFVELRDIYARVGAAIKDGAKWDENVTLNPQVFEEQIALTERWVQKLGLSADEIERLGAAGLENTISEARDAALNGTPAMDQMAGAVESLSDETANSTERLKAWKEMVDAALGGQKNLMDSTIAFKDSLHGLEEAVKTNGSSFDILDEKGRKNLGTVSTMIDRAVEHAGAVGESTGSIDLASAALSKNREAIIKQLEASGMSRVEAAKLVSSFGLSRDAVQGVADAAVNARRGIESIPSHKVVNIEWNETKRTTVMEQRLQDWSDYGRHYARRHSGGVFRASRPGGEGLALLRDGERVLTPNQQGPPSLEPRSGASYSTTVIVQVEGSVAVVEDLATEIDDVLRRRDARSPYAAGRGV